MKNQLHLASYLSNLASYLQEYYWWETWLVRFWLVDNSANTWKNLPCFLRKVPRHGRHVRKVPVRWKKSHMCAHSVCSLAAKVPLPQKSTSCQGKFVTNKNMMHLLASDWPISRQWPDFCETKWFKEELKKSNTRSKWEKSILYIFIYAETIFFLKYILHYCVDPVI